MNRPAAIGVVLAGGRSSRMGRDKATLRLPGGTLLDHMLGLLRAVGLEDCVVSGSYPGYRCLPDLLPQLGPVAALHALATALPDQRLLIVAIDTPLLPSDALQALLITEPDVRCLHFEGEPLPLRIDTDAVSQAAISDCLSAANPSTRSLRSLLDQLNAIALMLPAKVDPASLVGCNRPNEWQAVSRRLNQDQADELQLPADAP